MNTEQLSREVATSLWAIYHERTDAPHLIWPTKRDDSERVSEQESKILITQWLERNLEFYSIETPTRNKYIQKGKAALSARIDVTVYGSRDPTNRVLNLELKAGSAKVEAFRKDFEKLLREGVSGLWFHTLTKASEATWRSIEDKMCKAFDLVPEHVEAAIHSVHFAFCVLDPPILVEFDIDFSTDWRGILSQQFRVARENPLRPVWMPKDTPRHAKEPRTATVRSYSGAQVKALVFMPSIEPRSFIHLSTRGDSYALRSFGGARPRPPWADPDCKTTADLLAHHPIEIKVDVAGERKDVNQTKYWADRVAELNSQHGVG